MTSRVRLFIQLSRPLFLLGGLLVYALGVGIARYLGASIDWGVYFLGQGLVTTLQLSAQYLNEFFDAPADVDNSNRTTFTGGSGVVGPGKLTPTTVLMAATTTFTVFTSLLVLFISRDLMTPLVLLILALSFVGSVFYSTPPIRLVTSGYGELTTSFIVANLVPAFAFVLQFGEFHRLLAMSTFPLTALHLAMMLAFELPDYAADIKHEKKTMLVRLGWEKGMSFHNLLILTTYLLLGLAAWSGLPLQIVLPAFIPIPLGLLQIWQMRRIAAGARPNWRNLALVAIVLFASEAYMLAFAFWTN